MSTTRDRFQRFTVADGAPHILGSKLCEQCRMIFHEARGEGPKNFSIRRYCSQSCACSAQRGSNQVWTPDRIAELTRLWNVEGKSATEIADVMGCTRNAVIGMVHRLGLKARKARINKPAEERRKKRARASRKPAQPRKAQPEPVQPKLAKPAPERVLPPESGTITLMELRNATPFRSGTCKWPIGDRPPYLFCGLETTVGHVYCGYHSRIAYVPVSVRLKILALAR